MKHVPNILTLSNLFSGCIAIAFILHWQPFLAEVNGFDYWISGTQQAYYGCIFIFIAALFDVLDGAAARWLGVNSLIGKDLDSLADVISFGVAPSMILMKLLWAAWMQKPSAMDIPMLAVAPAFLLACFAALRLAKFNNSEPTTLFFTGVPVPAIGLLVASFPLIIFYNPFNASQLFHNPWVIYMIILFLSWLMVSKFKFFAIKGLLKGHFKDNSFQLVWLGLTVISLFVIGPLGVLFSFLLYLVLSLGMQKKLV